MSEEKHWWLQLTPEGISYSLFFYTAVISPGFLYFYLYHRDFFIETDWIKLLFLSSGLTLPILILNTLLNAERLAIKKGDHYEDMPMHYFKSAFLSGAWSTLCVFYGAICLGYGYIILFDCSMPKVFLMILVAMEVIIVIAFIIAIITTHRKTIKNKKSISENK